MREVKQLGFHFALDDFGVGTSSFGYLKSLPVDYLKIDGSFVKNIAHDPVERAMAETINRIGHIMGLQTVGEFAESAEVIEALRAMGVGLRPGLWRAPPRAPARAARRGRAAAARGPCCPPAQSGLILARAITAFQRVCSCAMNLVNSAGVLPTGIAASPLRRSIAAGSRIALAVAVASLSAAA